MIEMNWIQIRDAELMGALYGIARQRVPYATTLKILTITKAIEAEQKKAEEMAKILRDKYMKQVEKEDAEGKKYQAWELKDPTLEEELKTSEKEFATTKFKIRTNKLKADELANTELSAIELFKLEPIVELEGEEKTSHLKPVEGNA